jgi:hypothetical protein
MPIKEYVKEKWLEALRSGDYQQTRETLRKDDHDGTKFCCLGVLNDLFMDERMVWSGECIVPKHEDMVDDVQIELEFVHPGIAQSAGIVDREVLTDKPVTIDREESGKTITIPEGTPLWALNDGDETEGIPKMSFAEIAEVIEKGIPTWSEVSRDE